MIQYQVMRKALGLFPILNLSKSLKYNIPNGQNITKFRQFTFPGGEEHIKIDPEEQSLIQSADNMVIAGDTTSSSGLIQTILATDAVRSINPKINITLFAPYFPYARQDRRMVFGEPLSIKVVANIINQQKYNVVEIFDPHSDVTPALINNVSVISNIPFVNSAFHGIRSREKCEFNKMCLVSPDAGAEKKIYNVALRLNLNNDQVICCTKRRDVSNGRIMDSNVPEMYDIRDKVCIIVDDIIDGGFTFTELAKKLKDRGAKKVYLVVSHGIFSKGVDVLRENIDHVYTTDSFSCIKNDFVTTVHLLDILHHTEYYCAGKIREPFDPKYLDTAKIVKN